MMGPRRRWQAGAVGVSALLALGVTAPGVTARSAPPPDVVGRWSAPFEEGGAATPRCERTGDRSGSVVCKPSAAESAVLGDGRVLYFNGLEATDGDPGADRVRLLDLRSGTPGFAPPARPRDGDLFCSDLTTLPDGKLLVVGGTGALLFDPASGSFRPVAPMKYGRWYPSAVIGADGNPVVFGGATRLVSTMQVGNVRRTETYHADTDTWEENYRGPASETGLPLVPRVVLTPDGRFFYAGVGQMGTPVGASMDEALTAFFQFYDPKKAAWSISGPAPLGARDSAFVAPLTLAPPYDSMTLVTWGGTLGLTPGPGAAAVPFTTLTAIDAAGKVVNTSTGDLNHGRWFSSGVVLPDGRLLAVGGADKDDLVAPGLGTPVNTPELYDPATGKWTDMAPQRRGRGYHNTALLLPDMRVLLGGSNDPSFEVWSPPYLFRGPRPTIQRVQAGVAYGEAFAVTTPDADLVESVRLLRLQSPEHGNDSDQRALDLEFARSGTGTLTATAPPSGTVAPPGLYYLVVNKRSLQGPIPSVASIVAVGRTDLGDAPQPFPHEAPAPAGGSATRNEDTRPVAVPAGRSPFLPR